jgi:hypothetical protein
MCSNGTIFVQVHAKVLNHLSYYAAPCKRGTHPAEKGFHCSLLRPSWADVDKSNIQAAALTLSFSAVSAAAAARVISYLHLTLAQLSQPQDSGCLCSQS